MSLRVQQFLQFIFIQRILLPTEELVKAAICRRVFSRFGLGRKKIRMQLYTAFSKKIKPSINVTGDHSLIFRTPVLQVKNFNFHYC